MFAEPPIPPHSFGHINITISRPDIQQTSHPRLAYHTTLPQVTTPSSPTPITEGPHLPLRLTGKLGDILGSAPSTQVKPTTTTTTKLPLSPNRTPVEVEKLIHTPDHTQIYQRYFHVPNL